MRVAEVSRKSVRVYDYKNLSMSSTSTRTLIGEECESSGQQ